MDGDILTKLLQDDAKNTIPMISMAIFNQKRERIVEVVRTSISGSGVLRVAIHSL